MRTYAIINTVTKNTLENARTNMYYPNGNHCISLAVNPNDKFVLFEKTIEGEKEYFSNAWTSNDLPGLINRAKKHFSFYFDYVSKPFGV